MPDAPEVAFEIFERLQAETKRQHPDDHVDVLYALFLRLALFLIEDTTFAPSLLEEAVKKLSAPVH
jgi:hypothetical protein